MKEQIPTREEMLAVLERVRLAGQTAILKGKSQLGWDLINCMWWARAAIYGRQEGHRVWIGGAK